MISRRFLRPAKKTKKLSAVRKREQMTWLLERRPLSKSGLFCFVGNVTGALGSKCGNCKDIMYNKICWSGEIKWRCYHYFILDTESDSIQHLIRVKTEQRQATGHNNSPVVWFSEHFYYLRCSTRLCIWRCFHAAAIWGSRFPAQSLGGARLCCAGASSRPPPPLCCPAGGRTGTSPRCQSSPAEWSRFKRFVLSALN